MSVSRESNTQLVVNLTGERMNLVLKTFCQQNENTKMQIFKFTVVFMKEEETLQQVNPHLVSGDGLWQQDDERSQI